MSATFSQTLRSLSGEPRRLSLLGIVLTLTLLAGFCGWFFGAHVLVVETSEAARLEVDRAAHAIDAPVAGKIVSTRLTIGLMVSAGELLVELDAESEKRRLEEATAQLAAIGPELEALRRALVAEEQAIMSDRGATAIALEQARARREESEINQRLALEEASRAGRLRDGGAISDLDQLRKQSEADRQRAATDVLSLDVGRQQGNQQTRESQARARLEDLRRNVAMLEGRRATTTVTIGMLMGEIGRRTIRAPVAGRVGDAAELRPGAYVREGDKLGAVVPAGEIKVVTEFLPVAALGRIRPGQQARVRLDGYPWIEYGMLRATVTGVGSEVRAGRIRVELAVSAEPPSGLPLEHGLPGSVEVEVEQVTPAALVMRAVGKSLTQRASPRVLPPPPHSADRREVRP